MGVLSRCQDSDVHISERGEKFTHAHEGPLHLPTRGSLPCSICFLGLGGWIKLNLDAVLTVLTNTQVQVWYNIRGYIVSPHDHTNLFCFIMDFVLIPTFSCIQYLIFTSLISTVSICLCMHCLFGWKSSFPSLLHLSTLLYLTSLPHLYPSSLPHLREGYGCNKARMLVCLSRNE